MLNLQVVALIMHLIKFKLMTRSWLILLLLNELIDGQVQLGMIMGRLDRPISVHIINLKQRNSKLLLVTGSWLILLLLLLLLLLLHVCYCHAFSWLHYRWLVAVRIFLQLFIRVY